MVNLKKMCYSCPAEEGYLTLDFDNEINPDIYGLNNHTYLVIGGEYPIDMWSSSIVSASIKLSSISQKLKYFYSETPFYSEKFEVFCRRKSCL